MARGGKLLPVIISVSAIFIAWFSTNSFVPAPRPSQKHALVIAAGGTALGVVGMTPGALASPLEDAALKLADASCGRVSELLGKDKGKLAEVVSKTVAQTNYDGKVAAVADKAVEALLATDAGKAKETFESIDKALDSAVAKGGLVPPKEAIESVAKAVTASVESSGGAKFKAFIDAAAEQGSVEKLLKELGFGTAAKDAFSNFIQVAATTEGKATAPSSAAQAPAALSDAAVKFADASYPIVESLNKIGGKTVGPLAGKALEIAFSGDPAKVGKAADAALEVVISTNFANAYEVLGALDKALDAAEANNGLLPPKPEIEGVAQSISGALATADPGKLKAILPLVIDAANSADKFKVLGILGEGSGLVSKINPADVAAATSAAVALASASGAQ